MKYSESITQYDELMIQYIWTIFYTNHYHHWAKFVGVISKHNRGPVFLDTLYMFDNYL